MRPFLHALGAARRRRLRLLGTVGVGFVDTRLAIPITGDSAVAAGGAGNSGAVASVPCPFVCGPAFTRFTSRCTSRSLASAMHMLGTRAFASSSL